MGIKVPPSGPTSAKIMIVGEAPSQEEEIRGEPFVGASGKLLDSMLHEAGISRSECFVTNVARERPEANNIYNFIAKAKNVVTPHHVPMRDKMVLPVMIEGWQLLQREIERVRPTVIVPVGNVPLWALTGHWGIVKWRGSTLPYPGVSWPCIIVPTYHPAAILRQWDWRSTTVLDLKRVASIRNGTMPRRPDWKFTITPSFDKGLSTLKALYARLESSTSVLRISFDIETRNGHTACAGLSWSLTEAICIPLMAAGKPHGYWSLEEESVLVYWLWKILTHQKVGVVGQNILYDSQYTWRHWHFVPRVAQDTMISMHSLYSALPKNLAFQASMFCQYYVYWKDEGKNWRENMGEEQLWYYNCEDCVYTDEVGRVQLQAIESLSNSTWPKLREVHEFQQKLFWPVLKAMQLGVRIDHARRTELIEEVQAQVASRHDFLKTVLGHPLNPASPKQMHTLFYQDFRQPPIMKRGAPGEPSRPTLDDDALQTIGKREPLLRPIVNAIGDIRTLSIFLSNFLTKPLDEDGRMRTAYNIGGSESGKSAPKTYRLSSSENAFGNGANLQAVPSEKSKSVGKSKARQVGNISELGDPYQFPNIRSMFIPDPGKTFFDGDLDRADLQVFVWEIEDEDFKLVLKRGVDIHLFNAYTLAKKNQPPLEELIEGHSKYPDHRAVMKHGREFAKVFCHATDYVGGARTVAAAIGRTVHETETAQKVYLSAHPKIEPYWRKVENQIKKFRFVENKFGYRWNIFDRIDTALPEAVAWIPQSTVSNVINKIWVRLHEEAPEVEVLMQVHDSLCGQGDSATEDQWVAKIEEKAKIIIPYDDPLVIPFSVKTSPISWGDCK